MAVKSVQVVINGTTHTLTLNADTGLYEATITAPSNSSWGNNSGNYFPVTVKATDDAGNTTTVDDTDGTLGASLQLRVKETTKPAIAVSAPTEGQKTNNTKPTFVWNVTDTESGINSDTIKITIDGTEITTGITKTVITNGYQCSYTPTESLAEGNHTATFDVSDNDDNAATQASVNVFVDTVPPVLSVTAPENNYSSSEATITVTGTTSDVSSTPVTLTIKVNDGTEEEVTVEDGGAFSHDVTLTSGTNTIVITATDSAGETATVTRVVSYDSSAPVISEIIITPNPVNAGATFTISVRVTD